MEYRHFIFIYVSFSLVKAYTPVGYLGCYRMTTKRILDIVLKSSRQNSGYQCKQRCSSKGYRYAGTTAGEKCHCGSRFKKYEKKTSCNIECPGNVDEMCGGNMRISIYDTWQCVKEPCKNNATCRDISATSYICSCGDGWGGQNCSQEISKSSTLPTEAGTIRIKTTRFITRKGSTVTSELTSTQFLEDTYSSSHNESSSLMIVYILIPVGCSALLLPILITAAVIQRRRSRNEQANQKDDDTKHIYYEIADIYTTLTSSKSNLNARQNSVNVYMELKQNIKESPADQDNTLYLTPTGTSLGEYTYIDSLKVSVDEHT